MKNIILTIMLSFSLPGLSQTADNDSIKVQQLQDVVIEGQMQNVKPTVSTFYPGSNQKKSAQDAIDLLSQMSFRRSV